VGRILDLLPLAVMARMTGDLLGAGSSVLARALSAPWLLPKLMALANTLRESIEALKIKHEKSEVSSFLTVSIGLACREANTFSSENEFFKEADDLLYKAKEAGRNRVQA